MAIPRRPFVGLFGSHIGAWRSGVAADLTAAGVASFDPTDPRWKRIRESTGDALQPLVDRLVAKQLRAIEASACIVFFIGGDDGGRDGRKTCLHSPAARCELGLLAALAKPTFAYVEPTAIGRNYLWALMRRHPTLVRCDGLAQARDRAIAWMRRRA